jgi:hypothetical protein
MSKSNRRKRRISLAGGKHLDHKPTGRDRTHTNQPAEDPRKTALAARMIKTGISDSQDAARPLLGTEMGLCIDRMASADELPALTEAWAAISASFRNYRLLVIGQTGDPQGAAIGMLPEPMQTDPSLRVDIRTPEERIAAAKTSRDAWGERIRALPHEEAVCLLRALNGFCYEGVLFRDREPTTMGRIAVRALRGLASLGGSLDMGRQRV